MIPCATRIRTVLMYAQDTRGMGHITRTMTIARHILGAHPRSVVYVATRSKIAREILSPSRGIDYIKLPSRRTPKGFERTPEEEQASVEQFRELRSRILVETALGLVPDLVFVDHEPLGSSGEFREALWALKARSPATRFVFGLRDIMDDADRIREQWAEMGVYEALQHLYDGIAVVGSRELFDVGEAYAIPESVRPKLHYCGYVVRDFPAATPEAIRQAHGLPANGRLVLGAVGSGRDGVDVLRQAAVAIGRLHDRDPAVTGILVTGPFMPDDDVDAVRELAGPGCRLVTHADVFQLLSVADAAVCMGGYNTLCEGLVSACPMVIVPRATHKVEQLIRAELLAARGLVRCVHPKDAAGTGLVEALEWALARDRREQASRVREVFPTFDGASQLTGYLTTWLNHD